MPHISGVQSTGVEQQFEQLFEKAGDYNYSINLSKWSSASAVVLGVIHSFVPHILFSRTMAPRIKASPCRYAIFTTDFV